MPPRLPSVRIWIWELVGIGEGSRGGRALGGMRIARIGQGTLLVVAATAERGVAESREGLRVDYGRRSEHGGGRRSNEVGTGRGHAGRRRVVVGVPVVVRVGDLGGRRGAGPCEHGGLAGGERGGRGEGREVVVVESWERGSAGAGVRTAGGRRSVGGQSGREEKTGGMNAGASRGNRDGPASLGANYRGSPITGTGTIIHGVEHDTHQTSCSPPASPPRPPKDPAPGCRHPGRRLPAGASPAATYTTRTAHLRTLILAFRGLFLAAARGRGGRPERCTDGRGRREEGASRVSARRCRR